jgi:hypothetical protein
VRVHALAGGVELATQVVKDWLLSSFVAFAGYVAVHQELVKDTTIRRAQVLVVRHAFGLQTVRCPGCVDEVSGDVEVTGQYDVLPHLSQVANPRLEGCEEAKAEVVTQAVAVRWAVDAEEYEGWKLDDEAATFCIEGVRVDTKISDLDSSRIAADACIVGELSIGCRRAWWAEDAEKTFFCTDGRAYRLPGVDTNPRIA